MHGSKGLHERGRVIHSIRGCWACQVIMYDVNMTLTGTEHRVASAYHPQTNGLTERFNQTLKGSLIQVVNEKLNDWDDHIEKIMFSYRYEAFCICIIILDMIIYRTSIHGSTGYTPFFLMHFRWAKLPVHVQVQLLTSCNSLYNVPVESTSHVAWTCMVGTKWKEPWKKYLCC